MRQLTENWHEWPVEAKIKLYKRLREMPSAVEKPPYIRVDGSAGDRIQKSYYPEIILTGPARTGKSRACLQKLYRLAKDDNNAGLRALIMRKVRSSLSETGLVTLERDVIGNNHPLIMDGPSRDYRKNYELDNGSIIVIGGMDKPGKVLSAEYDIIFVQQAEEINLNDWETLITRLSGTTLPQHEQQIIGDCNPASPLHWIYQRSLTGTLKLWETYHKDNPLLYQDGAWTEYGETYLEKLRLLTGTNRERLYEGKWTQAEGVVYSDFNSENITEQEPITDLPIELAVDDGYIDPRAILFIQRTGTEVLVFDEIYHSRHLAETCVSEVVERCEKLGLELPEIVVGSPEAKELQQRFRMANIPFRSRSHKILDGIPVVRRLIKDGAGVRSLKVHKRCQNFITELTDGYRYPEEGSKRDDEKPLDGNDHACDAFRYWAYVRARR